jgi:transcription-repair coupling factor (superfamily II helicase)
MDLEIRGGGNLLGPEQSGNINAVGFEMFCELLNEATAGLQGKSYERELEPELTFDTPGRLPPEYIPDLGQRLHYYKRLATAKGEDEVEQILAELIDRYGDLPAAVDDLARTMIAGSYCRALRIPGLEASETGLTLHLAPDSNIDPERLKELIRLAEGRLLLSGDLKAKLQFEKEEPGGATGAITFLRTLGGYDNNSL